MSNEELNKKMEFIVEQQSQFAADIQVMREVQAADEKFLKEQYRKLSEAVIAVVGMIGSLTQAQTRADDRINLLAEAQTRTDGSIKLLTEAQARTDQRLNIFINIVERYISGNVGTQRPA